MDVTLAQIKKLLGLDYFSLFKITPSFEIDQSDLKMKYLDLQKQFHPDNFTNLTQDNELKSLVSMLSARINDGYNSLKNPLSRGILLLEQNGIDFDLSKDTNLPPNFLFQQIEFHDNIEDAKNSGDLMLQEALLQKLLDAEKDLILQISSSFAHSNFINAKDFIKQLAFYERLKNNLSDLMDA